MEQKFWHKSYAKGVNHNPDFEKTTITEALTRTAGRFPENCALNYMGFRISYSTLNRYVNQSCRALEGMGIRPGDKVAVCLPNIPQAAIANYAVLRAGAVAVQLNPLYTEREMIYQLEDSDSRAIITLSLLVPRMEKIMAETSLEKIFACHIHSFLPFPKKQLFPFVKKEMYRKITPNENVFDFDDMIRQYDGSNMDDKSNWDDIAALLYTGGTTGVSKGVMLTHANLSINVQQFVSWFPDLGAGKEKLMGNFPFFHSAGFTAIQNFSIWQGYEVILVPRPDPQINITLTKKYKPTFLPGVPTIFVGLLAEPAFRNMDLSSIKGFFSGAAPLPADTIRDLKGLAGADMCEVYGLTETAPIAAATPWGGMIKPGTVGCPLPATDIRIVDMETGQNEMPHGETGEIVIKGPQVMKGYYKKPEETEKALRDGWFHTGDVGKFDEDGYLYIVDRMKDMIIAGGYNVYPLEIDNVLYEHPKILEACAVGIPDEYRGETIKAYVVVKTGVTLTETDVIAFCKEHLAAYKVPRSVAFIDELPKSAIGKVLRRKLREMEGK